jgi:hypothetical protein
MQRHGVERLRDVYGRRRERPVEDTKKTGHLGSRESTDSDASARTNAEDALGRPWRAADRLPHALSTAGTGHRPALNRGRALALLAVALSSATDARCADVAAAGEAPRVLAIESVAVVDVVRGSVVAPRTVVVIDGRITMIAEAGAIDLPPHAQRVDGRSRYLIPGLVDMHVHLFNNSSGRPPNDWAFPLFIANGVTGVREMAAKASDLPTVSAWRTALAQGRLIAPHVLAAGVAAAGARRSQGWRRLREGLLGSA